MSADLQPVLSRINAALMNGDNVALAQAFDGVDLQKLLSQDTIAVVRAQAKAPLAMLLCTLAEHNDVEIERARHWLACYQSLALRKLQPYLDGYSNHHVLRMVVEVLIQNQPLLLDQLLKAKPKGLPQVWQDAMELLLDHKEWASALVLVEYLQRQPTETEIWRQITRCLSKRHKHYADETGQPQSGVDYLSLARLYELCAELAHRAKWLPVQRALNQLSASALEIAGEFKKSLSCLNKLDPEKKSLGIQLSIARCLCKAGESLKSIDSLDRALWLLTQQRNGNEQDYEKSLQFSNFQAPAYENSFDLKKASLALGDLNKIANQKQVPIFLVSGTLLGYVREGQLLAHDKDIDVGIVGWENQYALCMALQESGKFSVSAKYLRGKDTFYIPLRHNITGVSIDVFVYHPQGDKWITGVDFYFGYRQTFAFTPFELNDINFLDVPMKAPVNAELNLTENYGDWHVPDASYLSHLESPSTMNKGGVPYMLTARMSALSACIKHQPIKLQKVLTLMNEYQQLPGSMSAELINQLEMTFLSNRVTSLELCDA